MTTNAFFSNSNGILFFCECTGKTYGFLDYNSIYHLFLSVTYSLGHFSPTCLCTTFPAPCTLIDFSTRLCDVSLSGLHPLSYFKSFLKYQVTLGPLSSLCVFLIYSLPSWLGLENTLTAPLQRSKTSPTSVLDMTLNNLMVSFQ